jgi:hypothetical protein
LQIEIQVFTFFHKKASIRCTEKGAYIIVLLHPQNGSSRLKTKVVFEKLEKDFADERAFALSCCAIAYFIKLLIVC